MDWVQQVVHADETIVELEGRRKGCGGRETGRHSEDRVPLARTLSGVGGETEAAFIRNRRETLILRLGQLNRTL